MARPFSSTMRVNNDAISLNPGFKAQVTNGENDCGKMKMEVPPSARRTLHGVGVQKDGWRVASGLTHEAVRKGKKTNKKKQLPRAPSSD